MAWHFQGTDLWEGRGRGCELPQHKEKEGYVYKLCWNASQENEDGCKS